MTRLRKKSYVLDEMAPWKAATNFFLRYKRSFKKIAAYWPMTYELDTRPLIKILLENNINVMLPVVSEDKLKFVKWDNADKLNYNKLKFYEPFSCNNSLEPDLIIVPLLAYDHLGYRLGYGKGFYDKYYEKNKKKVYVGYCYSFQNIEHLPSKSYDLKLNSVITETETKIFN